MLARAMRRAVWVRVGAVAVASLGFVWSASATAGLPDGRGYEIVSPADKNGGDIVGDGGTTVSSVNGDGVVYDSRASFAGTRGSGSLGQTAYLARRRSTGWLTHAITPTPARDSLQVLFGPTLMSWYSDDLSSVVLGAYDLPGVSDDVPSAVNLYKEDTATGGLQTLTKSQVDPISAFDFLPGAVWGVSRDDSHAALVTSTQLLPDAAPGVPNAYDWSNGALRLAGILPNGSVPAEGSDVQPQVYRDTVSADGSRVAFISPPSGEPQLYMRIDGSRTVWISQSEATVPPPPPPLDVAQDVTLQAVSADGQHVLFTTSSRLLDTDGNDGADLYMYTDSPNPSSDSNLQMISDSGAVDAAFDGGGAVVGMSDDAHTVYFQEGTDNKLFVWQQGSLHLISSDVPRKGSGDDGSQLGVGNANPGGARVSVDGTKLAFLTNATIANDHVHALTGQVTNHHIEMYVYDASRDALTCVSCPTGAVLAASDTTVVPNAARTTTNLFLTGLRPRFLSADGSKVFFSTADALVANDTNGITDVYEYDTANLTLSLLSPGSGVDGTWFAEASTSGHDVFLVTRQQLVHADHDGLIDLYDARVGGGLPDPPAAPTPCVADECQGGLGGPPGLQAIGSVTFTSIGGPGQNVVPQVRVARSGSIAGASGALTVRVPTGGRLSWSGVGTRTASRRFAKAGSARIKLTLTAHAKRLLAKKGIYRATVKLVFTSTSSSKTTARIALTFKTSKKGHGH